MSDSEREFVSTLVNLKRQVSSAIDALKNGIQMRDIDNRRQEHPNAICCVGDFAIYRRFPKYQSLREHANESMNPEDCPPPMSLEEIHQRFPDTFKAMMSGSENPHPDM